MKERKRYKNLMKHLGHPEDRDNASPLTPLPLKMAESAVTKAEIEMLMRQSRMKLIDLENMMNLKIAQEHEMDCCPAPNQPYAPPAPPDAQLQLGDASVL